MEHRKDWTPMKFFALADLHLANAVDKPMDKFGKLWHNHQERIQTAWTQSVSDDDVVLVPGDISWALTLEEALPDLQWIGTLPGTKLLVRGNHDYWWSSISRVRRSLPDHVQAIQNDAVALGGYAFCGTRGWLLPSHPQFQPDRDEALYRREQERLRLSLRAAADFELPIVCMLHYPPLSHLGEDTRFTSLLSEFGVQLCIYGHLHHSAHRYRFEGEKDGVSYLLVSADYLQFQPRLLPL
ncbi:metallophosphoesterase [Alicyclobacillus herbarius]|uniref:metallophosphoesterase n=1 Tax=Alicyclobacillus herbarius TaxID=122960 RepID=UPI002357A9E2|nr:metallophosphoesterase [Alicyclobacillus herbarius]